MWVAQLAQLWIANGWPLRGAGVQHRCAAPQEVKAALEKEPCTFEKWLASTLLTGDSQAAEGKALHGGGDTPNSLSRLVPMAPSLP